MPGIAKKFIRGIFMLICIYSLFNIINIGFYYSVKDSSMQNTPPFGGSSRHASGSSSGSMVSGPRPTSNGQNQAVPFFRGSMYNEKKLLHITITLQMWTTFSTPL